MEELLENEAPAGEAPSDMIKAPSDFAEAPSGFSETPGAPKKKKKNRKKAVRRVVTLAIVAALAGGGFILWKKLNSSGGEEDAEIIWDMVQRGAITSMVEGSGAAVAKNSASVTLLAGGQVREVFVAEGDYVTEGTPLYTIDSAEVEQSVDRARERLSEAQRQLSERQADYAKAAAKPTEADVTAEYAGILLEVEKLRPGDKVTEGATRLATLVDNTRLLLPLYFSYAYDGDVYVGQSAEISIPATMAAVAGSVYEIHKVERISTEGSKLFEVVFAVDNPGTLTADMAASATITAGGETIYPYETGRLEYFRTTELYATMTGELTEIDLHNYARVAAGEKIAHIRIVDENRADELKSLGERVEDAQKAVEEARTALDKELEGLDALSGVAPIDGTVLSLGVAPGEEVKAGTIAVSIADTSTMIVNAAVDEMNVSYAKAGMPVNIELWGEPLLGVIESVSLSAQAENGVARFPMVISVDNSEGKLMSGAYVQYSFTASQNDDCLYVQIQSVKSVETEEGTKKVLFVHSDVPPENTVELISEMDDIPADCWPVEVETGISDSYNVEILSGVEEFTEVYSSRVMASMW